MADRILRQRQRVASQGGIDEQARHLVQRLRAGDLSQTRLRLAAYAGSEAALLVLGDAFGACSCYDVACTEAVQCTPCCEMGGTLSGPLSDWTIGLRTLASGIDGLGDREERKTCMGCHDSRCGSQCSDCGGKGWKGIRRAPWDGGEWVMLRAAIAAAELVVKSREKRRPQKMCGDARCCLPGHNGPCMHPRWVGPIRTIQAAKDYQRLGTLAAREAWSESLWEGHPLWLPAPPGVYPHESSIIAAARVVRDRCACQVEPLRGIREGLPTRHAACGGTGRIPDETKVRAAICKRLIKILL